MGAAVALLLFRSSRLGRRVVACPRLMPPVNGQPHVILDQHLKPRTALGRIGSMTAQAITCGIDNWMVFNESTNEECVMRHCDAFCSSFIFVLCNVISSSTYLGHPLGEVVPSIGCPAQLALPSQEVQAKSQIQ
ncbi:hypothetical protein EDB81DRAFT_227793 [Dactylonectria macrodidyma]|uniref:Uncharacterized protein n=1 Tax=Dactylonectria macrodidyma TaxID=307937 RepID=A0A9P9DLC3_9HYPO|nr:hypothetical protein EDB81DRAFT_227793 [Dactylonectria macrodidyma]